MNVRLLEIFWFDFFDIFSFLCVCVCVCVCKHAALCCGYFFFSLIHLYFFLSRSTLFVHGVVAFFLFREGVPLLCSFLLLFSCLLFHFFRPFFVIYEDAGMRRLANGGGPPGPADEIPGAISCEHSALYLTWSHLIGPIGRPPRPDQNGSIGFHLFPTKMEDVFQPTLPACTDLLVVVAVVVVVVVVVVVTLFLVEPMTNRSDIRERKLHRIRN